MTRAASSTRPPTPKRLFDLWRRRIARNRWFKPAVILMGIAFLLDQLSKHWILYGIKLPEVPGKQVVVTSFFNLSYVENYGVSFGMFSGGMTSRILLSLLSVSVAVGLFYWLAKIRRPAAAFGIAMIIAGALGNAYDRILYGFVVDFLDFSAVHHPWLSFKEGIKFIWAPFHWVFNIADTCINIGVGLLLYDAFWGEAKAKKALASKPHNTTTKS